MRSFKKGDKVLILLPTDNNKLLMQWKGPYQIVEVMSRYNYKVLVRGKSKTYHANLLKEYVEREKRRVVRQVIGAAVIEAEGTPDEDGLLELGEFGGNET